MVETAIQYNRVFAARARPCTAHTRIFRLFEMQNLALRAPLLRPSQRRMILPAKFMVYRENPAKNPGLGKNPLECGTVPLLSYCSIMQLQMAL